MRVRGGGYLPDITYIDCSRILGFLVYHRYSVHVYSIYRYIVKYKMSFYYLVHLSVSVAVNIVDVKVVGG